MTALSAGNSHACVLQHGAPKCWGYNLYNILGDGSNIKHRTSPTQVIGLEQGVTHIAAGFANTCAIQRGALKCWGLNETDQISEGGPDVHPTPTPIRSLEADVTDVAVGDNHTCVIQRGVLQCWGANLGSMDSEALKRKLGPMALD